MLFDNSFLQRSEFGAFPSPPPIILVVMAIVELRWTTGRIFSRPFISDFCRMKRTYIFDLVLVNIPKFPIRCLGFPDLDLF